LLASIAHGLEERGVPNPTQPAPNRSVFSDRQIIWPLVSAR